MPSAKHLTSLHGGGARREKSEELDLPLCTREEVVEDEICSFTKTVLRGTCGNGVFLAMALPRSLIIIYG